MECGLVVFLGIQAILLLPSVDAHLPKHTRAHIHMHTQKQHPLWLWSICSHLYYTHSDADSFLIDNMYLHPTRMILIVYILLMCFCESVCCTPGYVPSEYCVVLGRVSFPLSTSCSNRCCCCTPLQLFADHNRNERCRPDSNSLQLVLYASVVKHIIQLSKVGVNDYNLCFETFKRVFQGMSQSIWDGLKVAQFHLEYCSGVLDDTFFFGVWSLLCTDDFKIELNKINTLDFVADP